MKKILLLIAALAVTTFCQAQIEKNVILRVSRGEITYVQPVEKKETVGRVIGSIIKGAIGLESEPHPEFADNVRTAISGAIGRARRLVVTDSQFLEGEVAPDEPAFIFDGSIGSISCASRSVETTDDKGRKHTHMEYRGVVTVTINIKDVHTDQIVKTVNFNGSEYDYNWIESPEKAIGNAIIRMENYITNDLNLSWPLYASIIEGNSVKKDKQKEVYIDLGEMNGAFKGMTFNVYTVKVVAGREAKREIGRLKITEVMGDDVSLCKVTKGGIDIKNALDAGAELLITSTN
ncbi:MAG: hypothetical protein Q4D33_01420 [Prevotellaceae bacterium]|nr:hypothetical protein [Prevotellaceae bacterium]